MGGNIVNCSCLCPTREKEFPKGNISRKIQTYEAAVKEVMKNTNNTRPRTRTPTPTVSKTSDPVMAMLEKMDNKMDNMEARLENMEKQLNKSDQIFDYLNSKLKKVDERITKV